MAFELNAISFSLPKTIQKAVQNELSTWKENNKIFRLWSKDASLWSKDDESKWLAWLDVVQTQLDDSAKFEEFAKDVKSAGFTQILLLGMGGSSLCPEVFSQTFGIQSGFPELLILDSTVPAQIEAVEAKIDLAKTLFIVASKSGSTLEPNCFKQYFFEKVSQLVGRDNAGKQFIAITDPNSKMQKVAEDDNFRKIFFGDPEIGGRFSALSNFGMIPAAAMGLNAKEFLERANSMVDACKNHSTESNPGAILGIILGICHKFGRDKLTIFSSPEIHDLGAWLEQLIAESTGKIGVSIIPVDREPHAETYSDDRIFVFLKLKDSAENDLAKKLEAANQPIIKIDIDGKMNLGQEFFRWEFATAVAGSIMQINPFNQPDVEAAKIEAKKITQKYEETGSLPLETPFFEEDGIKLFSDEKNVADLDSKVGEKTLSNYLAAHFSRIVADDYFALLAYVEMNPETEGLLQEIRGKVLSEHKIATCLGFGPRFLHSTGQGYKGGANNGVFLQITSEDAKDLPVPEQKFTFGVVKAAQARGDFQVLIDRNRRALRIHLGSDVLEGLKKLQNLIASQVNS